MNIIIGNTNMEDCITYTPYDISLIQMLGDGEVDNIIIEDTLNCLQLESINNLLVLLCQKLAHGGTIYLTMKDWYELSVMFTHNKIDSGALSEIVSTSTSVFTQSEIVSVLAQNKIKIMEAYHEIDGYKTFISGIKSMG